MLCRVHTVLTLSCGLITRVDPSLDDDLLYTIVEWAAGQVSKESELAGCGMPHAGHKRQIGHLVSQFC